MKKVIFVIGSLSNGGAERVISILANELSKLHYSVEVILLYKNEISYKMNEEIKIRFIDVSNDKKVMKVFKRMYLLHKIFKNASNSTVISFLSQINIYSIIASIHTNTKLIVSERNDPYQVPTVKSIRIFRNFLYKFIDKLVCQTEDAVKYFNKTIQKKSIVIYNPLNEELLNMIEKKKENSLKNNSVIENSIVSVVRLEPQKRVDLLIEAFYEVQKQFPEYRLIIYGDGSCRKSLSDQIISLNLQNKVYLPGFVNRVNEKIKNAYMFVICSEYEGMSNSLIEAMALGLPVISTNSPIGGAKMLINNEINGILIPVNNKDSLVEAMIKILENPEFRNKLARNASNIVNIINNKKIIDKWIDLIER